MAMLWYEQQQEDLADRFYQEAEKAFEKIRLNPFLQIRYNQVRCMVMERFPYMIHFTLDQDQNLIIIRAVFHTSINPENWNERL